MPAALIVHIGAGVLGILSGAIALAAAKGGRLHRVSGTIFFTAMLLMSAMGSFLAVHLSQRGNVMGGAFAFYLVATAWITVKTPARHNRRIRNLRHAAWVCRRRNGRVVRLAGRFQRDR